MSAKPVTVGLAGLRNGTISLDTLNEAFGPDSLGIIIVKDVLPEYVQLRQRVLSYASYLGNLPPHRLAKLEHPEAKYLTGWSRGKEMLKDGKADTLKGSYYVNCAFYVDDTLDCAEPTPEFSASTFPEYLSPNSWPSDNILPGFRSALEDLCRLIIDVAVLVAQACDRFAEKEIQGYEPGQLARIVKMSTTTKARLLHYFPTSEAECDQGDTEQSSDDWCATHTDHGALTGLTSAMFIDEAKNLPVIPVSYAYQPSSLSPLMELDAPPDPQAGLYIQSRTGQVVQVRIPKDCLAFQTGAALESITQGKFKAVPHYVRGVRANFGRGTIARNTLAIFTQPNLGDLVDPSVGLTFGEFARGVVKKNTATV